MSETVPVSSEAAVSSEPAASSGHSPVRARIQKPGWSLLGVLLACFGYVASLTPTLLPRTSISQAMTSAVIAMSFYALGAVVEGLVRAIVRTVRSKSGPADLRPARSWMHWIRIAVAVIAVAIAISFTARGVGWQSQQRAATAVPGQAPESVMVIGFTLMMCIVLLAIARAVRAAGRGFARLITRWTRGPFWLCTILGGLMVVVCAAIVGTIGFSISNVMFDNINDAVPDGQKQPTSSLRSGGPGSLVSWQSLGQQGRWFVQEGPTPTQITQVTGKPALEPIRAYAGIKSSLTIQQRAELAMSDLVRAGGLKRKAIIVYTPSTNGLVDPTSSAGAEYVSDGNVASISIQYTVLPSFLSIALSTDESLDTGRILLQTVRKQVDALPPAQRPKVYVFGESLGAFGSLAPFDGRGVAGVPELVDGAIWGGPPANSAYWRQISTLANKGPAWQPIVDDGLVIRFAANTGGLITPPTKWTAKRAVFLQNDNDPVVWWDADLLTKSPAWLNPRGPNIPSQMTWLPFVTWMQVLMDMPAAGSMPSGIGHNYGNTIGPAWVSVLQPSDWKAEDTEALQRALNS